VPPRLTRGSNMMKQYGSVLGRIEQTYGVPGEIIMAIWGLETDFGVNLGKFQTLRSLASLAYDCRRSDLFKAELMDALRIVERGDVPPQDLRGAWAGEIGQTQFMPSNYIKYAVDFDGNGDPYQAQWWRCGSPNRKKGRFPINYVLIQPPRGKSGGSAITLTNSGNSDEYFIEEPQKINVEPGPGSRQLLLVSGRYYDADEGETSCLLGPVGEQFQCWPSDERERLVEESSRKREKSLFRKVDEFLSGQNLPPR